MSKVKGIIILLIFIVLGIIAYFFFFNKPYCSGEEDCLVKHIESCTPYGVQVRSETLFGNIDFIDKVNESIKVIGNKNGERCDLFFEIKGISNQGDSWALNKSMTCSVTLSELGWRGGDSLILLKERCTGSLSSEALKRCEVAGSTGNGNISSPWYKCS